MSDGQALRKMIEDAMRSGAYLLRPWDSYSLMAGWPNLAVFKSPEPKTTWFTPDEFSWKFQMQYGAKIGPHYLCAKCGMSFTPVMGPELIIGLGGEIYCEECDPTRIEPDAQSL